MLFDAGQNYITNTELCPHQLSSSHGNAETRYRLLFSVFLSVTASTKSTNFGNRYIS